MLNETLNKEVNVLGMLEQEIKSKALKKTISETPKEDFIRIDDSFQMAKADSINDVFQAKMEKPKNRLVYYTIKRSRTISFLNDYWFNVDEIIKNIIESK